MKRFAVTSILWLTFFNLFAQPLAFYRESLNFELDSAGFYVSGMYFFRNPADKPVNTMIFYPYVYETSFIDTITVTNVLTGKALDVRPEKKAHSFPLYLPAGDSVILHIKYHHQQYGKQVTYILTTTKYWHQPFTEADYTLRVQKGITVTKLFMEPDTTWNEPDYKYYYWKRQHFMPETDFTVEFQ